MLKISCMTLLLYRSPSSSSLGVLRKVAVAEVMSQGGHVFNAAFQGGHCTKPVFFKLCMDKVMSMHNEKRIKTCYEWSRKGIEEKKKKKKRQFSKMHFP